MHNKNHEQLVELLFIRICEILGIKSFKLRMMKRTGEKNNQSYTLAYIDLQKKLITLDIYTPKTLKPKSLNSLIRTICHELAHYQKKPYRQYHRGKWITRQHYPAFYKQVEKNINQIKKDIILGVHFR